ADRRIAAIGRAAHGALVADRRAEIVRAAALVRGDALAADAEPARALDGLGAHRPVRLLRHAVLRGVAVRVARAIGLARAIRRARRAGVVARVGRARRLVRGEAGAAAVALRAGGDALVAGVRAARRALHLEGATDAGAVAEAIALA